jgi:hypothetical protein
MTPRLEEPTMKSLVLGLAAAATLAIALPAAAQGVDTREHNQAVRVDQGVRSGALTSRETERLERAEARLHRAEYRARLRHHGYLTPVARHRLQRMENRDSRLIYRLKHNRRVD